MIDQNYYQSALEIFQNDENIDFIYAKIEIDHVKHGKMIVTPNDQLNFTKMPYPHPSLIVRKKVFEKIGYFDLNLKVAMDYDFAIRLINSGCKGYFYQHNSVVLMDGTGVSSHQGINGQKERIAILKKYQRLNSQALIYQYKLLFKVYARKTLSILGFIQCYDKCKKKFFDIKPE